MTTKPKTATRRAGARTGNKSARGRAKRAPTFTLKSTDETLLTTKFEHVARAVATSFFADIKSVSLVDNERRKVVARWNYGHAQPLRQS